MSSSSPSCVAIAPRGPRSYSRPTGRAATVLCGSRRRTLSQCGNQHRRARLAAWFCAASSTSWSLWPLSSWSPLSHPTVRASSDGVQARRNALKGCASSGFLLLRFSGCSFYLGAFFVALHKGAAADRREGGLLRRRTSTCPEHWRSGTWGRAPRHASVPKRQEVITQKHSTAPPDSQLKAPDKGRN